MRTQLTNIKDRECAQMYQKKTFPVSMNILIKMVLYFNHYKKKIDEVYDLFLFI
jgi:hypothetical protein